MPRRNQRQSDWTARTQTESSGPMTTEQMARSLVERGLCTKAILDAPRNSAKDKDNDR